MTEEQKQALIGLCKIEIKRWKAASESDPNMRYMVELMGVALSALTAEPVADVVSWNHPVENRTCAVQLRRFDLLPGELFTAPPAPAAELAELVPEEIPRVWDGTRFKYVKDSVRYAANYANGHNACRAAMLRKIEEKP